MPGLGVQVYAMTGQVLLEV